VQFRTPPDAANHDGSARSPGTRQPLRGLHAGVRPRSYEVCPPGGLIQPSERFPQPKASTIIMGCGRKTSPRSRAFVYARATTRGPCMASERTGRSEEAVSRACGGLKE
jgi:hypothetical protein